MKNGYIRLHRKILDNPISKKPAYAWLWTTLLLLANHKENEFIWNNKVEKVKKGQLLTGRKELAKKTGIPASTIEDILKFLETQHQIQQQKTTKWRLITILKWKEYQFSDTNSDNKATTKQQQADTNNNDKNEKNDKKILIPAHEEVKKILKRYIPIRDIDNKTNLSYLVRLYNALDKDTTKVEALCKAVEHFSKSEYPYSIYSIRALYEKLDKIRARVAQEQLKLNNKKPTWITL